jgi:hypothetical protein
MILASRDKDGTIPVSDVGSLLSLLSSSGDVCKMKQSGVWKVNTSNEAAATFTLAPASSSTLAFQFDHDDQVGRRKREREREEG